MNFLLMLGMMGLMLLVFHGRGHHKVSPEPNHHTAKPAVAPAPPEPPGATHRSGESLGAKSQPDPAGDPKAEPTPPATPPPVTQAE